MKTNFALPLTFLLFVAGLAQVAKAQDPSPTLFSSIPTRLNPAFAGSSFVANMNLHYRSQWPFVTGVMRTYNMSADWASGGLMEYGFGVRALREEQGEGFLTRSGIGFTACPQFSDKNGGVRFAFEGMYLSRSVNWNNLLFGDQLDPSLGVIAPISQGASPYFSGIRNYFDANAGILGYGNGRIPFTAGLALHHLFKPNENFIGLTDENGIPRKLTLHGTIEFRFRKSDKYKRRGQSPYNNKTIEPNIAMQWQGNYASMVVGANLKINVWGLGLWYRGANNVGFLRDAVGFSFFAHSFEKRDEGQPFRRYKGAVAFDYPVSLLQPVSSSPSYEVALATQATGAGTKLLPGQQSFIGRILRGFFTNPPNGKASRTGCPSFNSSMSNLRMVEDGNPKGTGGR